MFQDKVILFQFECHLNVVSSEILIIVTIVLNGITYCGGSVSTGGLPGDPLVTNRQH